MSLHIQHTNDPDGTKLICLRPAHQSFIQKISLVYYPPHLKLAKHHHDVAQLSLMLSGKSHEECRLNSKFISPGKIRLKPYAYQHENEFGPRGAMYLSINLHHDHEDLKHNYLHIYESESTSHNVLNAFHKLLPLFFDQTSPGKTRTTIDAEQTVIDTLTELSPLTQKDVTHAPGWLHHAKEALSETSLNINDIARQCGVHRVHLSRIFKQYFGCTISSFRQAIKIQECIHQLIESQTRTIATINHQFSDQSHMNRLFKNQLMITPAQLRQTFRF